MAETSSEPAQPSLLEKKMNMRRLVRRGGISEGVNAETRGRPFGREVPTGATFNRSSPGTASC
jgi:hypothetical protein